MKKLTVLLIVIITISTYAQDKGKFLYGEIGDLSVTLTPFYKPFGGNLDLAISLGAGIDFKQNGNSTLFQTVQLMGYSAHIIGDGLNLTTSFGYRYMHTSGITTEFLIGAGASLFYSGWQTFSLDENGTYTEVLPLHIIATVPVGILFGYDIGKYTFYIKYRYMLQAPYASAMPVLPTSISGIGIRYSILSK